MELTSTSNEKVKYLKKLQQKKYRDSEKLFLIEDEHLVNEALKLNLVKEILTITDEKYNVPTYKVNDKIIKYLSNQASGAKIIGVCKFLEEHKPKGNMIILDNLQDPGNLGTIIRSAVAFNFDTIVLGSTCVDLYNPKVIRASEGMIFNINILKRNLVSFLEEIKDEYTLVTTSVINGKSIKDIEYEKIAIVIGNEGSGVSDVIASKCPNKVYVKMNNKCESLNAGVSASILMYEVNNE